MSREIERKWLLKPDVNINDIIADFERALED